MVKRYNENEIKELVKILKNDGVISAPTDTVYGLCSISSSENAYNKLMEIKKRPANKQLPIMFADKKQMQQYMIIDSKTEIIIDNFMPGPITLILKKKKNIPLYNNADNDTLAVRMATSETLKKIISKLDYPIFMSSANISGESPCTSLDEIEKTFPNLDGILEGKPQFGISSTIVDCTKQQIQILRSGPISLDQINKVINKKI